MNKFRAYDWKEYHVLGKSNIPAGAHYQALVFSDHQESDGYGGSNTVSHTDVFAFAKKEHLDIFVKYAAVNNVEFVFYHVNSLGRTEISVKVDVNVEGK